MRWVAVGLGVALGGCFADASATYDNSLLRIVGQVEDFSAYGLYQCSSADSEAPVAVAPSGRWFILGSGELEGTTNDWRLSLIGTPSLHAPVSAPPLLSTLSSVVETIPGITAFRTDYEFIVSHCFRAWNSPQPTPEIAGYGLTESGQALLQYTFDEDGISGGCVVVSDDRLVLYEKVLPLPREWLVLDVGARQNAALGAASAPQALTASSRLPIDPESIGSVNGYLTVIGARRYLVSLESGFGGPSARTRVWDLTDPQAPVLVSVNSMPRSSNSPFVARASVAGVGPLIALWPTPTDVVVGELSAAGTLSLTDYDEADGVSHAVALGDDVFVLRAATDRMSTAYELHDGTLEIGARAFAPNGTAVAAARHGAIAVTRNCYSATVYHLDK